MNDREYPPVLDEDLVGFFETETFAGGGLVWDAVLEYRVWVHSDDADDCVNVFRCYRDARAFSEATLGAESPVALILQRQYIDEVEEGQYVHVQESRMTEWPVEFLARPARTEQTIPEFLSPDAPENRLDILRGNVD
ncbi:GCN5 family acetyltransferase [Rhodopirellula sp. MGV]|uniref:GCN5 family acetyltransferase n=1 Tax=Rhodopirellula sp. MGV TaxID=2023130 RepID=UPI000B95FD10|nr:GCN5 family acetyltransferase [Rhodopirellula sp. MGV]OYP34616.1 GCN5 family acetyltransferase [Rhodopirellula sp. MGV]PNY37341.1 GCN5 family acetyltransferase [Rhodopirellula baltica]